MNKTIKYRNSPELLWARKVHKGIFIFKNVCIFILMRSVFELPDEQEIRELNLQALRIFMTNIIIYFGFAYSLMKVDSEMYKHTYTISFVLYAMSTAKCILLLIIFIREKIRVIWFIVVSVCLVSIIEFIYAAKIKKSLEPVALKNILYYTRDKTIIDAYKARCRLYSMRLGIFNMMYNYLIKTMTITIYKLDQIGQIRNTGLLSKKFEYVFDIITLIIDIILFCLLTIRVEDENKKQRQACFVLTLLNIFISMSMFLDFIILQPVELLAFNLVYVFHFVILFIVLYAIYEDQKFLGSGLKEIFERRERLVNIKKI